MKVSLMAGLIILYLPFTSVAQIYKSIEPDGSITYSDQAPTKEAQPIKLEPISTITAREVTPPTSTTKEQKKEDPQPKINYSTFKITSPRNDSTIRENSGSITIQLDINPQLNTELGHTISINLDGKQAAKGTFSQTTLNNIDRGTHTVSANIHNKQGKVIRSTATVSFHLLRFSILHKKVAP